MTECEHIYRYTRTYYYDNSSVDGFIYKCLNQRAQLSDCIIRKYSAAIVKNDQIIGLGHSNIPYGVKCSESNCCIREGLQNEYGDNFDFFEICPVIHAEMAAILSCDIITECKNASLYLLGINQDKTIHKGAFPCSICLRHIVHIGIDTIRVIQSEKELCEYKKILR